jgi:hypothetical protein
MNILYGTERTIIVNDDNTRTIVRHNPPRDWKEVLTDYGRQLTQRENHAVCEGSHTSYALGEQVWGEIKKRFGSDEQVDETQSNTRKPRGRLLEAADAQNVLDNPLIRLPGTTSGIARGIRLSTSAVGDGTAKPSLGQFTDFRSQPRKIPQLHAQSVAGILRQPGALSESLLDEQALKAIACEATAYRRQQGVPGFDIGAESAELYIRIFRALGLQEEALTTLDATQLERMYLAYLSVHAG